MKRWIAQADWITSSALHCGGADALGRSATDMRLVRDASGRLFIPGSSIIGAARSHAARRALSPSNFALSDHDDRAPINDSPAVRLLFGNRLEFASLLSASDAPLQGEVPPSVRDGVRIDPRTGQAHQDEEGGSKFDLEVIPAPAKFRLRLELRLPDSVPPLEQSEIISAFGTVLRGFQQGEIPLGARTRRGYGAGSVREWDIRSVIGPAAYVAWLKSDPDAGDSVSLESLDPSASDSREFLEVRLWLNLKTSLLIRSGGNAAGDPDAVQLTESGRVVLPGTSLGGLLRHRCARIARTLRPQSAEDEINAMFGPTKRFGERTALSASRVYVSETEVFDVTSQAQTRVAIDRFTQAALEAHLFTEAAVWPNQTTHGHFQGVTVRLESEGDDAKFHSQAALLLMAIKDLWLGSLSVGGGAAVGRGVCSGRKMTIRSHLFSQALSIVAASEDPSVIRREGSAKDWQIVEDWCRTGVAKEDQHA